jgi:hypothetical protein
VTAPQQPRCDVPLATRSGRPISNSIDPRPAAEAVALAMRSDHVRLSVAGADRLQPPTGLYNCHGLVFASRRSNVPAAGDDLDITQLLRADGYERVLGPRPGDVVAYVDPRGDIEHTGFVSTVEQLGSTPVVHVWSAWGGLGEFRHRVDQTPYSRTIQYWRLTCH